MLVAGSSRRATPLNEGAGSLATPAAQMGEQRLSDRTLFGCHGAGSGVCEGLSSRGRRVRRASSPTPRVRASPDVDAVEVRVPTEPCTRPAKQSLWVSVRRVNGCRERGLESGSLVSSARWPTRRVLIQLKTYFTSPTVAACQSCTPPARVYCLIASKLLSSLDLLLFTPSLRELPVLQPVQLTGLPETLLTDRPACHDGRHVLPPLSPPSSPSTRLHGRRSDCVAGRTRRRWWKVSNRRARSWRKKGLRRRLPRSDGRRSGERETMRTWATIP